MVEGMRGPLAGDLGALQRSFDVAGRGRPRRLGARPDARATRARPGCCAAIRRRRRRTTRSARSVSTQANGDEQWMQIGPSGLTTERRRGWPVAARPSLAAVAAARLPVLSRITVRTDMAEFLPRGETEAARLVMDEARAGTATGLILIGIEGADAAELARISRGDGGRPAGDRAVPARGRRRGGAAASGAGCAVRPPLPAGRRRFQRRRRCGTGWSGCCGSCAAPPPRSPPSSAWPTRRARS